MVTSMLVTVSAILVTKSYYFYIASGTNIQKMLPIVTNFKWDRDVGYLKLRTF